MVGATNSIIAQTGNGVGLGDINWGQVALGSFVGGVTALASAGLAQYGGNQLGGIVVNKLSISAQSAIGGAVTGAIGGAVSGYGAGFIGGMIMTKGDWSAAHKMGMNGLKMGAAIGLGVGAVTGAVQAHKNGNNIWTGKSPISGDHTTVGRWMSTKEYNKMLLENKVQEGAGGQTFVTKGGPDSFQSAKTGSIYTEFDVPTNSLLQGGRENWFKLIGPNASASQQFILRNQGGYQLPKIENISPIIKTK